MDREHPLSQGRVAWLASLPGLVGTDSRYFNIAGRDQATIVGDSLNSMWINGPPNSGMKALLYNGTSQYASLNVTNSPASVTKASFGCWVNPTTLGTPYLGIAQTRNVLNGISMIISGADNISFTAEWTNASAHYNDNTLLTLSIGNWNWCGVSVTTDGVVLYRWNAVSGWGTYSYSETVGSNSLNGLWFNGADPGSASGVSPQNFFPGAVCDFFLASGVSYNANQMQDICKMSSQGYQVADSPIRWFSTRTFFVPAAGGVVWGWQTEQIESIRPVYQKRAFDAPLSQLIAPPTGIQFDGANNSGDKNNVSTVSVSASWAGNNRMLAVDVPFLNAAGSVASMTYGGAACTFINAQNVVGGTGRVEQWRICEKDAGAPGPGANTLVVNYSGVIADTSVEWASYWNVNQSVPIESWNGNSGINAGSATDATVVVTPVTNNCWVHWALATSQTSGIASSNTSRNIVPGLAGTGADSDTGGFISPASAQTGRWTGNGIASAWAAAGYAIRPVFASGAIYGFETFARDTMNEKVIIVPY